MKVLICMLGLTIMPALVRADTLTLTTNLSVNGTVRYMDDKFYLEAEYSGGIKHYEFPRSNVVKDEINSTTYNPGNPPPGITAYEVPVNDVNAASANAPADSRPIPGGAKSVGDSTTLRSVTTTSKPKKKPPAKPDKVQLLNGHERVGALLRITSDSVLLREKRSATSLNRNDVRFISVGH